MRSLLKAITLFLVLGVVAQAHAVGAVPVPVELPKPKITPETEKKLEAFVAKAAATKRRVLTEQLATEIQELVVVTHLNEAGVQALKDLSPSVVALVVSDWRAELDSSFRASLSDGPSGDRMQDDAEAYAAADHSESMEPEDEPMWKDGVVRALTPEQANLWSIACAEKEKKQRAAIGDFFRRVVDLKREALVTPLLLKSRTLILRLGLSKERAEQLHALAKRVADRALDAWCREMEEDLWKYNRFQREETIRDDPSDFIDRIHADTLANTWETEVKGLLTDDENKRVREADAANVTRRIQAVARVLLAEMDGHTALTSRQRQLLFPLCVRLAPSATNFAIGYTSSSLLLLYPCAKNATEADLSGILDATQIKRWQAASNIAADPLEADADLPFKYTDAEAVNDGLSDYMTQQAAAIVRSTADAILLEAEDITRAAALPSAAAARIQTAAKGVANDFVEVWKAQTETSTAELSRPQIGYSAQVGTWFGEFRDRVLPPPEPDGVAHAPRWRRTLKRELTAAQRQWWEAALEERRRYRYEAISRMIAFQFDQGTPISPAQSDQLEHAVFEALQEYGADIDEIAPRYGSTAQSPWYLGLGTLTQMAFFPEKILREILTADQWEDWEKRSREAVHWPEVEEQHRKRTKVK